MMRESIERTYTDRMTVTGQAEALDEATGETKFAEQILLEDKPCRISFETIRAAEPGRQADGRGITQSVKLFCAPELDIQPGCRIAVTRGGVTTDYCKSGEAARYATHQEILLVLFEEWA